MLFASSLVCILAGISIPSVLVTVERSRGLAAARYLEGRMALARAQAVGRAAIVALFFEQDSRGIWVSVVQDGNRDGVRTRDIATQVDRLIEPRMLLSELFPGVAIGLAPQTPASQPVTLGGTNILSFTPAGTSTSGSVYVLGRDGTQWAVRVLGVTARVRLLRFVPATGAWANVD